MAGTSVSNTAMTDTGVEPMQQACMTEFSQAVRGSSTLLHVFSSVLAGQRRQAAATEDFKISRSRVSAEVSVEVSKPVVCETSSTCSVRRSDMLGRD